MPVKSDLRSRLAVAGIGVPLCILCVYVGGALFAAGLGLVAAIGYWEFANMLRAAGNRALGRAGAMAAFAFPAVMLYGGFWAASLYATGLLMGLSGLAIATVELEERPLLAAAVSVFGVFYLGGLLSLGVPLREGWFLSAPSMEETQDRLARTLFFFFPVLITWTADTAAYFGGRRFGRRQLAPRISPNKTKEGAAWALVAATAAAPIYSRWVLPSSWSFEVGPSVAFGLAVGVFAIVGDLVESALKRECGVKDASNILPGHGGVLDRLDSLLWAIPTALLFTAIFK